MKLTVDNLDAKPWDMNSVPGYSGDNRILDNLVNGVNNTSIDKNMWLIPFNKGEHHFIYIDFHWKVEIKGLRIYNYNKSEEDSLRGTKIITIKADGKMMTPKRGVVVKKAIGYHYDGLD